MFIGGNFISFNLWELYGAAILMNIPAQLIAVPILVSTFQNRKIWFWLTLFVWIIPLPVLLLYLTDWLAPGIHSAAYRFSVFEQILKLYLPFYGIPPFLAGVLWIFIKKTPVRNDSEF